MFEFLTHLLDTTDFPARWHCGNWSTGHGWLHILSDLGIWSAYVAIPCVLGCFVLRRKDLPFRTIFLLFGAFILSCGATHLMEAVLFWWPAYRLAGVVKLLTAVVSWATVIALVPITPKALAMRSPDELEREVAERKKVEARLRKAEARYRNLVEGIPAVTFMAALDGDANELYVSPQIEALLGFSQKEWLEDPVLWHRQLHPDDRERWNVEFAPTIALGVSFSSVYRFTARDGRVVWVRGEARVVKDDEGLPLFLQGVAFDVTAIKEAEEQMHLLNQTLEERVRQRTAELASVNDALQTEILERRRKEEALRENEERMRSVVNHVVDGIITIDEGGVIATFNPAAEKVFGYTKAEVIGRNVRMLMPDPYHDEHDGYLANYLRTGRAKIIGVGREVEGRRKDASTFPMDLAVSEFRLESGRFFTGIVRDITERKMAEEDLRRARDGLEVKVNERTAELTRVNGRLQQSLEEKEDLLKEIHHRVKNNLQVISSLLQLQSQRIHDPESAEMFRESQHRVRSMALVHERLYRSPDLAKVDFADYIVGLANFLFRSYQVDADRILLEVAVRGVGLAIDAAVPCGLLVNELVSNCLKHAFNGRDRGVIRIELLPAGGGEVLLSVRDDGVGLPAGLDPQAFGTFGMQLVAALVDQLHGRLEILGESGAAVRIVFPLEKGNSAKRR